MIDIYAKDVKMDNNGKPVQWYFYTPWHQEEPLLIASKFNNEMYVAVLGFGEADFSFIINDIRNIADEIKDNLRYNPKALHRIISVGVFG